MSNALIALFVSLGVAGWVYGKTMRKTGNNTQTAITVVAVVGIATFLLAWFIFSMIPA